MERIESLGHSMWSSNMTYEDLFANVKTLAKNKISFNYKDGIRSFLNDIFTFRKIRDDTEKLYEITEYVIKNTDIDVNAGHITNRSNLYDVLDLLLKNGLDVNKYLLRCSDISSVQMLLNSGYEIDYNNLLCQYIIDSNPVLTELLLQRGIDIPEGIEKHFSIISFEDDTLNTIECIKILLKYGFDINKLEKIFFKLLKHGEFEIVKILLELGFNTDKDITYIKGICNVCENIDGIEDNIEEGECDNFTYYPYADTCYCAPKKSITHVNILLYAVKNNDYIATKTFLEYGFKCDDSEALFNECIKNKNMAIIKELLKAGFELPSSLEGDGRFIQDVKKLI